MTVVLDAAAVLAVILDEPGAAQVHAAMPDSVVSAVNLSEVYAKLLDHGTLLDTATTLMALFGFKTVPFDEVHAVAAGVLRPATRARGVSFGDRACRSRGQMRRATI